MNARRRKKLKPASPFQTDRLPDWSPAYSSRLWQRLWLAWLTALLVAAPLIPSESAAAEGTGIVLVMMWLVLLAAWSVAGAMLGNLTLRAGPTTVMLVVFLSLHSLSAVLAVRHAEGRPALNMLWQWVSFGAAFFLARQLLTTSERRRAVTAVMVGLAVMLSTHGLFQYAYSMPRTREAFERNPEAELAKAGIDAPPGSPARKHFQDRLASTEPIATFALTNSLAGFLSPWLLAALGIAATNWNRHSLRWRLIAAAGFSVAVIGICWVLTKSRSAWLATLFGFGLLAIYGRRSGWRPDWRWVAGPVVGGVLLLLAALVLGGIDWLVLTESAKSVQYRFEFWQATAAMVVEDPWWGCGPGNFKVSYTAFKLPQASETISEPHNFLLEVWATAGTPALLALLGVFGAFAWQLWRATRTASAAQADAAAREVSASAAESAGDRDEPSQGDAWSIYLGALCGVMLAFFPCGFLVGYMPDPAILFGVPAGALAIGLWHRWVRQGGLPLAVLVAAVAVLLVNLLAAGGIGYAGVALSLWLLMALALGDAVSRQPSRSLTRVGGGALAAGALATVMLCHATAYQPILASSARLSEGRLAQQQYQAAAAEKAYEAAAAADPYAARPWQMLAELRMGVWLATREYAWRERYLEAVEQMLRAEPRSSVARTRVGDWSLNAYRATNDPDWLERAVASYREAIELYPNSNFAHAQLAWSLHLAGDHAAAGAAAAEALRLDALNPHRELQLARRQLHDRGPGEFAEQPAGPPADAEQAMRELRTN